MMGCELLPFKKKEKRNGSNGYGFVSVCAADSSPLMQRGTPYAAVCIFYEVSLLTCSGRKINSSLLTDKLYSVNMMT